MLMSDNKKSEGTGGQSEASCLFLFVFVFYSCKLEMHTVRATSTLECNVIPEIMFYCYLCVNIVNLNMSFFRM